MVTARQALTLWLCQGASSTSVRALGESGASFDEIIAMRPDELASLGLRRAAIESIAHVDDAAKRSDAQLALAEAYDARVITLWDESYPARLREIYAAPVVLFVRGTLDAPDANAVAIVGTRAASTYGRLAAERYGAECASIGVSVVSGLARGIDIYAHLAALDHGGRTIAVVASGLDAISPSSSERLAERIARNGCVLTEHPFGVRAIAQFFPQRNRIISGIAAATIVVESDVKGGAMITAGFAMDQNREVFAVPGPITSPKSRGTNLLLRTDRARLTQTPDDVFVALNYRVSLGESEALAFDTAQLSMFEQQIFDALSDEPRHVDELCDETGIPSSEMLVNLLQLEFKGLARQMAGKLFLRPLRIHAMRR